MSVLSLALLGTFQAEFNGHSLSKFRTKTVQALLVYLTCQPGTHSREHLMTLLWPGLPQTSAAQNLRQNLYLLRRAIPEVEAKDRAGSVAFVLADRQTVQVNPDGRFDLDCQTFSESLAGDESNWPEAVALYRGDFLADFYLPDSAPFEEWVLARRSYWQRQVLLALESLAEQNLNAGNHQQARQFARRQLEIDDLREKAHRQLMAALAQDGRRLDALNHYESFAQLLQTELVVEPSAETLALYEAIRSGDLDREASRQPEMVIVAPAPSQPSVGAIPNNLRQQPTPLIGRETELSDLDDFLTDSETRLVSIVGPGGMGKTRLAIAYAERCVAAGGICSDLFAHGIYFVNLAPLSDVNQIIPELAQSLGFPLRSEDARSPRQQVLDHLHRKRMLLVIDNLEHLLDGVDVLVEIASTAPGVRLVVTTRERLRLQLEQVYPLHGLAFPETGQPRLETREDALAYAAVELFAQCAQRNQPDFDLQSAGDLAQSARICRLVAGMPLAIELAASWVDTLSLADIADEIQQSLDFLETERPDMPERHRSVRAAIDNSWNRLGKQEQASLAQLSIFRGGFTREAAKAVTGASPVLLSRLVNRSFLHYDREANRYQIHELLRQFAAEKLALDPVEETAARDRHSAFFCDFLQQRTDDWHTQQMETQAAMVVEAENSRGAMRWALQQDNWVAVDQSIDSWARFLSWQGRFLDGELFCQGIIDKAMEEDAREPAISAEGLLAWVKARAWMESFDPDEDNITGNAEQSLALLRRPQLAGLDTRPLKVFVRLQQARLLAMRSREEARSLYEIILTECQEMGDQWGMGECLFGLGWIDYNSGRLEPALKEMEAVGRIWRERGDVSGQAVTRNVLGFIHHDLGNLDQAERLHRDALRLSLKIGYRAELSWQQANLARTLLWQGRVAEAFQLSDESVAIAEQLGIRYQQIHASLNVSEVQIYAGQYQDAHHELDQIASVGRSATGVADNAWLTHLRGLLALIDSSFAEAQSAFETSLTLWHGTYPHHFVSSLTALGLANIRLGQLAPARQHLAETLTTALTYKSATPALAALPFVALLLAADGDTVRAVEIWSLCKSFPFIANSPWFEDVAGREIESLTSALPPAEAAAALAQGRSLDLWATAEQLLEDLN